MDFSYDEYEKQCEKICAVNYQLLDLFEEDLRDLSPKTVRQHVSNVDFYINDYLLYEDALSFEAGIEKIDDFLGNFFIRKCMWSTPGNIKSTAASIKKFYKCMLDHGKIQRASYNYLCSEIKERMPKWQADCEQYNDIDADNPFDYF
ncbi:Uncharacterised protein [[Eubacterium] contortum]|uniref:Recombinase n=1 Tax=Faecalicatena contorta TaxID=39482 RepID=A0A174KTY3_9FIRM|nr:hypothetical protein [Faecalicatena contorta]CUP13507.1 Uncharacterised protein [[Eubacterium] contortum] [Faecalicatena contorta]